MSVCVFHHMLLHGEDRHLRLSGSDDKICVCVCVGGGLVATALGGLRCGGGCAERRHRKRVKARVNWKHMCEATGRGIIAVEQERQLHKTVPLGRLRAPVVTLLSRFFPSLYLMRF